MPRHFTRKSRHLRSLPGKGTVTKLININETDKRSDTVIAREDGGGWEGGRKVMNKSETKNANKAEEITSLGMRGMKKKDLQGDEKALKGENGLSVVKITRANKITRRRWCGARRAGESGLGDC